MTDEELQDVYDALDGVKKAVLADFDETQSTLEDDGVDEDTVNEIRERLDQSLGRAIQKAKGAI